MRPISTQRLWSRFMRCAGATAAALALAADAGGRVNLAAIEPVRAVAQVNIVQVRLKNVSGIAVESDGSVLVVDREAGSLIRISPSGTRETLLTGLRAPSGVAVSREGDVLLLESGGGCLLRLGRNGTVLVVLNGLRQPKAVAVDPDGRIWIAMRRSSVRAEDSEAPGDSDDSDGAASEYVLTRLNASGLLETVASGLMGVQALAAAQGAIYVAQRRLAVERGPQRTLVARVPIRADGSADVIERVPINGIERAYGVAVDALGSVFVMGSSQAEGKASGVIVKHRRWGGVSEFAAGLRHKSKIAFGADGALVAAEEGGAGRLIRFEPPAAPTVDAPPFTNRQRLAITGRADPGDRVEAFHTGHWLEVLATATARAPDGLFTITVPLTPNDRTQLSFVAMAAGGAGLAGSAAVAAVVHDDRLPRVTITAPAAGAFVRTVTPLRATAEDAESGVADAVALLDEVVVAAFETDTPEGTLIAVAAIDSNTVSEGAHTVTVAATDRAGNMAASAQLLVVDRTPPETLIVSAPPTTTVERDVSFVVDGNDLLSPGLEFSWRLDGGQWVPYSPARRIVLTDLTGGAHQFEVAARDLGGNEDPSPARHLFSVIPLRLRVQEPAPGAVIGRETMWVRGSVEGAETTTVGIRLPADIGAALIDEMTVPVIAGTFAAEVPVASTTQTITVTARDSHGNGATEELPITVQPPLAVSGPALTAAPAAGFAPLTLRFSIPDAAASQYVLDIDSDGINEHEGPSPGDREFTYTAPGVYLATLTATGPNQWVSRTAIHVYDREAVRASIASVWNGFRVALRAGDILHASEFIHRDRRARWDEYLRELPAAGLPAVDVLFPNVELFGVSIRRAEGEVMREVDGLLYSYPVSFVIDNDGKWRLWQF